MTKLTTASYVKITLIIALGLLILGSIGFGGCSAMRFGMRGGTEMGSANVDAASVKNLSVKWASGAVNIDVVDEGDAIELVETAPRGMTKAQQMRWSVNGDTLSIDYGTCSRARAGPQGPAGAHSEKLRPEPGAVEIDGASGDYDVNGLGCETLKLKLASGDVDGQHLQADELRVDVASGQLDVEGRFADRVDVRTASGQTRIVCREACPKTIDADIASGSVSVAVPESSGFTARIEKASGRFSSSFSLSQNGNVYTSGDGSASINARLASGEFRIDADD